MISRKGYVQVYALIIMTILMVTTNYLVRNIMLESHISINTKNNIQSYYLAEGKIYMTIYDKYYHEQFYPFLVEVLRGSRKTSMDIIMDSLDFDEHESPTKLKLSLMKNKKSNRMEFELKSDADYKGIKTSITASGTVINEMFELGIPILNPFSMENYRNDFNELLKGIFEETKLDINNLPSNTYGGQFTNFEKYYLENIDNMKSYLYAYRETMQEPYVELIDKENIVLIIKKYGENDLELSIGNENMIDKPLELRGLIFAEGNIIIYNKLNFNGILILKDGNLIIKSNLKPSIKGLIISMNDINEDDIEVTYNSDNIYKFGTYIPGFIEPKIQLLKNNWKGDLNGT